MAEIEKIIVQKVIAEIDEGEIGSTPAPAGTIPMHAAGDTVLGVNYGPGSAPMLGGGNTLLAILG